MGQPKIMDVAGSLVLIVMSCMKLVASWSALSRGFERGTGLRIQKKDSNGNVIYQCIYQFALVRRSNLLCFLRLIKVMLRNSHLIVALGDNLF